MTNKQVDALAGKALMLATAPVSKLGAEVDENAAIKLVLLSLSLSHSHTCSRALSLSLSLCLSLSLVRP